MWELVGEFLEMREENLAINKMTHLLTVAVKGCYKADSLAFNLKFYSGLNIVIENLCVDAP